MFRDANRRLRHPRPRRHALEGSLGPDHLSAAADNVRDLIAAARGAPPPWSCDLAADAVGNGWGGAGATRRSRRSVTPGSRATPAARALRHSAEDVRFLLESLSHARRRACASCAVRLLGSAGRDEVAPACSSGSRRPDSDHAKLAALGSARRAGERGGAAGARRCAIRPPAQGERDLGARADRRRTRGAARDRGAPATRSSLGARGGGGRARSPRLDQRGARVWSGSSGPTPSLRCGARPRGRLGQLEATEAAEALAAALREDGTPRCGR